jgi:ketosteroid isomerase-like protein
MKSTKMLWLVTALGVALVAAGKNPGASAAEEVQAVERERVGALVAADVAALERLLGDDLTYTHSTGWVETKAQHLESVRTGALKYEKMEHSGVQARVYGAAAVLTGRSDVRVRSPRGGIIEMQIRFTGVYVKRAGRWQLVAWQSTRIPEPAAAEAPR